MGEEATLLQHEVADALNVHTGREFAAHFQYLAVGSYFDGEGLPELSRFFFAQADEEHVHAMKFLRFVLDAGGEVEVQAVPAPKNTFESAEEAVALSLDWEHQVTRHIDDLVALANAHNDNASNVFLQWFVTEQVEEVSTMTELLQVVRRAGDTNLLLVEDYIARTVSRRGGE